MNARSRTLLTLFDWVLTPFVCANIFKSTTVATVDYARETGQPCSACQVGPKAAES